MTYLDLLIRQQNFEKKKREGGSIKFFTEIFLEIVGHKIANNEWRSASLEEATDWCSLPFRYMNLLTM